MRVLPQIFSRAELSDAQLDMFVLNRTETHRHPWRAYPVLKPVSEDKAPRFRLGMSVLSVPVCRCLVLQSLYK